MDYQVDPPTGMPALGTPLALAACTVGSGSIPPAAHTAGRRMPDRGGVVHRTTLALTYAQKETV